MPRPAAIRQADLVRIARAMEQAGVPEWRVEVSPSGKIALYAGRGSGASETANPCDELLEELR